MADVLVSTSQVDSLDDFGKDGPGIAKRWQSELQLALKEYEKYFERCRKIVKRYRDERDANEESRNRLNVLWSTVETSVPAIYQRPPRPEVGRRFKTKNAVTRCASQIIERYLAVDLERDKIDGVMPKVVQDRLLCSRGQLWVEYEPVIKSIPTPAVVTQQPDGSFADNEGQPYAGDAPQQDPTTGSWMGSKPYDRIVDVRAPVKYLFWHDFLCSPARAWSETRWVARKHRYTRDEIAKKFTTGQQMFGWKPEDIPLAENAVMSEKMKEDAGDLFKRAVVWEIWNDEDAKIFFIVNNFALPIEVRAQPFRLESRFPCPEPYFGTMTNDTLVPVPDFCEYQDLADEIDELSQRIAMLTKACKVVGARAAEASALDAILEDTTENELVPVDNWAVFRDAGGIQGAISWLPVDEIAAVLDKLVAQRSDRLELLSQISGIGELLRGQGDPNATATHDRITANFGSLRLQEKQQDLARFVEQTLQIKAQIIADTAPPDVLIRVSSIDETPDAQYAPQAIALLKDESVRDFKIEVEEASMVAMDESEEKSSRMEFLQTIGPYLQGMVNMPPPLQAISGEMLSFAVRGFRVGRELEGAIEQFIQMLQQQAAQAAANPQPPQPPLPLLVEQAKSSNAQQLEGMRHQDRMQEIAADGSKDQAVAMAEAAGEANKERIRGAADATRTLLDGQQDRHTEIVKAAVNPKPSPAPYVPTMTMPIPRSQRPH